MNLSCYYFLLCVCILSGCSSIVLQNTHYILNGTLESSYQDIDNSLHKRRGNLLFHNEGAANNCKSYFLLHSKYNLVESISNQQVKSEYLICDALAILLSASLVSNKEAGGLGEQLASKLDLRTFPSSLKRAGSGAAHTLKSIFPEHTQFFNNVAERQTKDWAYTIEVVAVAKINDNASPDWIVWVLDEAASGNYSGYSTLIIYDPERQKQFKAVVYPPPPKK